MNKPLKLIVVGTQPSAGRGGISTALEGYIEGLRSEGVDYVFINSHIDRTSTSRMLRNWISAVVGVYSLVKSARKSDKSPVVWLHGGAWLSLFRKFTIALAGRIAGAKVVIQIHSQSNLNYLTSPFKRFLFKAVLSVANSLFVLTPWWKSQLSEFIPKDKINVVSNPVNNQLLSFKDFDDSTLQNKEYESAEKINIVAMSRLVSGKGFEQVINAMKALDDSYQLLIAGDGPLMEKLKKQVDELSLNDKVKFLGWLNLEDKLQLFCRSDVFCLPSKNDSFGMVYIEAMATGLPIVALDYGAIPDVVIDGESGVLCESDTPQCLAEGIIKAINNKEYLVKGGFKRVENNYTPQTVAKQALMNILEL